jgi:hypothetical protein
MRGRALGPYSTGRPLLPMPPTRGPLGAGIFTTPYVLGWLLKASRPWLVLVINDNIRLYVTNVCFAVQMVS